MIKIISKLALISSILAGLYLLIVGSLFSFNIFLIFQVLGLVLMVWARRSFHHRQFNIYAEPKDGGMITSGPYKFIRHPMYTSALIIIWSGILGHFSSLNLIVGVMLVVVISIRVKVEENYLLAYYPEYLDFSRKSKLIIPFII